MSEGQIIPDDQLYLARQFGVYDEWECRLENYLYDNNPDAWEDKEYIIMLASAAREVAQSSKHPLHHDDAHNRLMSGVSRSLYETIYDSLYVNAEEIEEALHPFTFRYFVLMLAHDPGIQEAVEKTIANIADKYGMDSAGLIMIDNHPDIYDEVMERLIPQLARDYIEERGGLGGLITLISEDEQTTYDEFCELLKKDYRQAFNSYGANGLYTTMPKRLHLTRLADRCIERGDDEPPYFYFKNQHGEFEEVPLLPDWAVDRYFQGNPEMKAAFHKYKAELEEYYEPLCQDFLDRLKKNGALEYSRKLGLQLYDKEYFYIFDVAEDYDEEDDDE